MRFKELLVVHNKAIQLNVLVLHFPQQRCSEKSSLYIKFLCVKSHFGATEDA